MTETTFDLNWIRCLMSELASECPPIFHDEADFQHKLAWLLQNERKLDVHVEYPYPPELIPVPNPYSSPLEPLEPSKIRSKRGFLDIWLPEKGVAIELKYCTKELPRSSPYHDRFSLSNQGAQDQKRYDFLRDVQRLERLRKEPGECKVGYAVILTNDSSYWKPAWTTQKTRHTSDKNFRLNQGRRITKELYWEKFTSRGTETSKGTMKNREDCIHLNGCYTAVWEHYSPVVDEEKPGQFQYLAFRVPPLE